MPIFHAPTAGEELRQVAQAVRRRLVDDGRPPAPPPWLVVCAPEGEAPGLVPSALFLARVPRLPPCRRAKSQLNIAVRTPPMCR